MVPHNFVQERRSSLNIEFLGGISRRHPGGCPGGRPGPKTFTPSLGAQENKVFCADVLDPKARTSMTRERVSENFIQENFGLISRSLLLWTSNLHVESVKKGIKGSSDNPIISSSLMGSLAKGFLRKVCRNSAENSRKLQKIWLVASGKGGKFSAMTPSRRTPYVNR